MILDLALLSVVLGVTAWQLAWQQKAAKVSLPWQAKSSADTRIYILRIPHVTTKTFGQRCFSYSALKAVEVAPF